MKKTLTTYAGMFTQTAFNQLYGYMRNRIYFKHFKEEVSFLMGRAPYFYSDYEEMNGHLKLGTEDLETLNMIFNHRLLNGIQFDKDEVGAYNEPRLVRVFKESDGRRITYKITHPWKCEEKFRVIKFSETIPKIRLNEQQQALTLLSKAIKGQIAGGFFCHGAAPFDIFHKLKESVYDQLLLRPVYVKQLLYEQIGRGKLATQNVNGRIQYVTKELM